MKRLLTLCIIAVLAVTILTAAQSAINLKWEPAFQVVNVGDVAAFGLYAVDGDAVPSLSAMDVVMAYNPTYIHFSTVDDHGSTYKWFMSGFLWPSPDGINEDLGDGQMMYTAWAELGVPAVVRRNGIRVTNLRFTAEEPTCSTFINIPSVLGSARTRVFSATSPNMDIKGTLDSARVMIVPQGIYISVATAKSLADESVVQIAGPIVTRAFDGFFYIEDYTRTSGIRVNCASSAVPSEGTLPTVSGLLRTIDGERVIDQASVTSGCAIEIPDPLGINTRGTEVGLSPAGLLMRVAGRVRSVSGSGDSFILSDGADHDLKVELHGTPAPQANTMVTVTGVLGKTATGLVLRVNNDKDIIPDL